MDVGVDPLLVAGVVVLIVVALTPSLAKRTRLPVIVLELMIGIFIGVSLLDLVPEHELIELFSTFGIIYIMFLAGLEVDLREVRRYLPDTLAIASASIAVPFICGFLLSDYIGVDRFLLGTIFSTTSLGLVLPLSKEMGYRKKFSHVLLGSVIVVDILSMFILAFSLSMLEGALTVTFIFYLFLVLLLFVIPWLINWTDSAKALERWLNDESHFEVGVRFSFALIAVLAMVSLVLGFHAIIGAFVAGLIISELTPQRDALCEKKSLLDHKLESFGYGFFIPIFFIFVGARTNVRVLFEDMDHIIMLLVIIAVGVLAKVVSVLVMTRLRGFSWKRSTAMGFLHSARLSLIIAAVEIGRSLEYIDEAQYSAFIILALVSAILGPIIGKSMCGGVKPLPPTCDEDLMHGV